MIDSAPDDEVDELFDQIKSELQEIGRDQKAAAKLVESYCEAFPDWSERIESFVKTLRLLENLPSQPAAHVERERAGPALMSIGDYRIVREIGRGGMGIVYEAEQKSLGRRVALKVLPSTWIDGEVALARFKLEARIAARMHHTNIVPIFEVGAHGQQWFYAMQLIDGQSLDEMSGADGQDSLPWEHSSVSEFHHQIAEIGRQAAEALKYAHGRGVIHRDIKPSNLLIDSSGVVWITDFGLAKSDQENLTQTGDIPGTLRYMSPERFSGQCDERADIYALGMTLYELLTHSRALGDAGGLELVNAIRNTTPPRPRSIAPSIPTDLETVVVHAMEKDPAHRYQTATDLVDDLHRFLDGEPIAARRTSAIERIYRWSRRRPAHAASVAAIATLTLLIAIGSSVAAWVFLEQRDAQRSLTNRAQAAERTTQRHLYSAHSRLAGDALWSSGGVGRMRELTDRWHPDKAGVEMRGWEWYFLRSYWGREQLDCRGPHVAVPSVDWSPDGLRFAECRTGAVNIRDAVTGDVVISLSQDETNSSVRWSPDGKRIACGGRRSLGVWDVPTQSCQWARPDAHPGKICSLSWNPQGTKLATTGTGSDTRIWDASNGQRLTTLDHSFTQSSAVQWSPDGTRLAFSGPNSHVHLWNQDSGRTVDLDGLADGDIESISWHPDGSHIAAVNDQHSLLVWDGESGVVLGEYDAVSNLHAVHWHPDGDRLAVCGWDGTVRVLDSMSLSEIRVFYGHLAQVWDVRWSPDGTRLLTSSSDGHVKVWNESDALDSRILLEADGPVYAARFSPCGRYLVAVGNLDHLLLWRDLSRKPSRLDGHGIGRKSVGWKADGNQLVTTTRQGKVEICDTSGGGWRMAGTGSAAAWNPARGELAMASREGLSIVAASTGDSIRDFPAPTVLQVDWSPNGDRVAAATTAMSLLVWNAGGDRLFEMRGHDEPIRDIRWSPDSNQIASCGVDRSIRVWDSHSGRPLLTMRGHTRTVQAVSWSPDGTRLASASRDRTVRIWDANTGDEVLAIPGHRSAVSSVDWSPDGAKLVSTSEGGEIRIWDASRCDRRQTE